MIRRTKTINTNDYDLSRVQDNVMSSLDLISSKEILDGISLKNVSLLTGANTINHTLGRKPLGYFIVRKRAQSDIWDTQDSNPNQAITLILNCSANVTVDLWIY